MGFPAPQTSLLVEAGNIRNTAAVTPVTAATGDVIVTVPTGASVVNLPPVAQGGPVTVRVLAAFAVTVKTTDSSTINGVAGATGVAITGNVTLGVGATFVSDGVSAWYVVNG